jgi:hypothetical protein
MPLGSNHGNADSCTTLYKQNKSAFALQALSKYIKFLTYNDHLNKI